jgi:CBS domain-containing protein
VSEYDLTPGAIALRESRVADVMSAPLVTCSADVPLGEVAELMARHRIHAVIVLGGGPDDEKWGVLSEIDLVAAAPFDEEGTTAGRVAGTPAIVVDPEDSLGRAAALMAEYAVTHLVATNAEGEPAGIVSALDIAQALAPSEEEGVPPAETGGLSARPGDRLIIRGHHLGEHTRDAEILETRGPRGRPPFLVRWEDSGRVSLFYPGSDAYVERLA